MLICVSSFSPLALYKLFASPTRRRLRCRPARRARRPPAASGASSPDARPAAVLPLNRRRGRPHRRRGRSRRPRWPIRGGHGPRSVGPLDRYSASWPPSAEPPRPWAPSDQPDGSRPQQLPARLLTPRRPGRQRQVGIGDGATEEPTNPGDPRFDRRRSRFRRRRVGRPTGRGTGGSPVTGTMPRAGAPAPAAQGGTASAWCGQQLRSC